MFCLLYFYPHTLFFAAAVTQFSPGIIKLSSDLYLISTSACTQPCVFLQIFPHLLHSSPGGTNHTSPCYWLPPSDSCWATQCYGHVLARAIITYTHTHFDSYCTAWTNPGSAVPCWLAAWIVWKHLVSVCCLNTPPSPPPPCVSVCATSSHQNTQLLRIKKKKKSQTERKPQSGAVQKRRVLIQGNRFHDLALQVSVSVSSSVTLLWHFCSC